MSWPRIRLLFRNMEDTDAVVDACTELVVCSLGASTMLAAKEKRKHSTWVKQSIRDRQRMVRTALCFQNWKPMIWVDTYSIWGWTSVRSRNNKISNENPASTGSLAVSKRFFFYIPFVYHSHEPKNLLRTWWFLQSRVWHDLETRPLFCSNLDMSRPRGCGFDSHPVHCKQPWASC